MPIEAVVRDVRLPADEPLRERRLPLERLLPRAEPGAVLARNPCPEALGALGAEPAVRRQRLPGPVRALRELGRGREAAPLLQQRLDVGHGCSWLAIRSRFAC